MIVKEGREDEEIRYQTIVKALGALNGTKLVARSTGKV